jgi:D-lactate dehydrogenase
MGPERSDPDRRALPTATADLLRKAGFNIIYPENLENLCCGMAFSSKGFKRQGETKARELERALRGASRDGAFPVLADMSPCLHHMREAFSPGLQLYEPVGFILEHVIQRLTVRKLPETVAVHVTCSSEKMGLGEMLKTLAGLCAEDVVVPRGVGCCGWAGDRGFTVPELNASALAPLRDQIPPGCSAGYSNSRTCEIGLSQHGGIPYKTIVYLVDRASEPSANVIPPNAGTSADHQTPRPAGTELQS